MNDFLKFENGKYLTLRDLTIVYIPMRYEPLGYLKLDIQVSTLGIFDMELDGKERGFFLPARIVMVPDTIEEVNKDGELTAKLTFKKGSVFSDTNVIVKEGAVAYTVFNEMFYLGNMPKFMTYKDSAFIFDRVIEVTGLDMQVDHSIYELYSSIIYRDTNDISKPYRLSRMQNPPTVLPLRVAPQLTTSLTGRIVGNYMGEGIDSALVNPSIENSEIEDLLRS